MLDKTFDNFQLSDQVQPDIRRRFYKGLGASFERRDFIVVELFNKMKDTTTGVSLIMRTRTLANPSGRRIVIQVLNR